MVYKPACSLKDFRGLGLLVNLVPRIWRSFGLATDGHGILGMGGLYMLYPGVYLFLVSYFSSGGQ